MLNNRHLFLAPPLPSLPHKGAGSLIPSSLRARIGRANRSTDTGRASAQAGVDFVQRRRARAERVCFHGAEIDAPSVALVAGKVRKVQATLSPRSPELDVGASFDVVPVRQCDSVHRRLLPEAVGWGYLLQVLWSPPRWAKFATSDPGIRTSRLRTAECLVVSQPSLSVTSHPTVA
jgi:hypothetical protein